MDTVLAQISVYVSVIIQESNANIQFALVKIPLIQQYALKREFVLNRINASASTQLEVIAKNQCALENILKIPLFAPHEEDVFLQTSVYVTKDMQDQNVNSTFALENPQMIQKCVQEKAHAWLPITVHVFLNNTLEKNVNMQFVLVDQQQIHLSAQETEHVLNTISANAILDTPEANVILKLNVEVTIQQIQMYAVVMVFVPLLKM